MSDVDTLRKAAALMRERAEKATADVCPEWTHQAVRHIARNCDISCEYSHGTQARAVPHDEDGDSLHTWDRYDDAEHIASWTPAAALAVADWLDHAADRAEAKVEHGGIPRHVWSHERDALAVATAYLGDAS